MKRAKSKAGRRTSHRITGRASRKPVDMAAIREQIKNQVGNAAAEMVANGIEEANKGHYAAMKFLFELVGLYPLPEGAEESGEEDSLAKTLLSRMGVLDPAAEVTNDSPATVAVAGNAVE